MTILAEPEDQPWVAVVGVVPNEPGLRVAALAISRLPQMAAHVQDPRVGAAVGLPARLGAQLPVLWPVHAHVGGVTGKTPSVPLANLLTRRASLHGVPIILHIQSL